MKKQYHDDGVSVTNYNDGRIKVKIPTRQFVHLRSISAGIDGIYNFLRDQGFKSLDSWNEEDKSIPYIKSYNELHTGHVCYVYRPRPELETAPIKPKKAKPKPKPKKPKPKKKAGK